MIEKDGEVVPVEVKAGNSSTASLNNYISTFNPTVAYKLIDGNVGVAKPLIIRSRLLHSAVRSNRIIVNSFVVITKREWLSPLSKHGPSGDNGFDQTTNKTKCLRHLRAFSQKNKKVKYDKQHHT